MFGKSADDMLRKVSDQLSAASDAVTTTTVSITDSVSESLGSAKQSIDDFSIANKIREFSFKAVNIVSDVDTYLLENNSPYEVASFRINTNIGVILGMALDIQFTKTSGAKAKSQDMSSNLVVTNPATGKTIKIPRIQIGNRKQIKAKDPSTGEVLVIDVETGQVVASHAGSDG